MDRSLVVNISSETEKEFVNRTKDELREEITEERVKDYLSNIDNGDMIDLLLDIFNISERCRKLEHKAVKDLTKNDRLLLTLYWGIEYKLH